MNTELLQENRSLGFANAESAPPHFAARICEIRSAILEKRPVPGPSRDFIEGAERRSALATPAVRKSNYPGVKIELSLSERLLVQAYQIRKDNEAYRKSEEARWAADPEFTAWKNSRERGV
jgi:formate dehydrogenase maturation protein FdhE